MNYVIVGINHKTAPIALREKLSFTSDRMQQALEQVLHEPTVKETAILSTCNRVEIYSVTNDAPQTEQVLKSYFSSTLGAESPHELQSCFYKKTDQDAVAHLFSVTASLDSLVVGENQIASQVKEAYRMASELSATGPYLNRLFHRALFVAKRIKTETDVGRGNVSVGSVGVRLAKKIFGTLADKTVLLLGAGEIGQLVLRHLHSTTDVSETFIINRSFEKARTLEEQGFGQARSIENFEETLLKTDILITSVGGDFESLGKAYFADIMQKRKNQPLFVIDLGLPRNVEQNVGELPNVYLYNIDDLKSVAIENQEERAGELSLAKNIIDEETRLFYETYLNQEALPTIAGLSRKFEDIRQREVQKTLSKMSHLSPNDVAQMESLTKAIVARILHDPILHLKNRKDSAASPVASVIKKIFSLDDEVEDDQ